MSIPIIGEPELLNWNVQVTMKCACGTVSVVISHPTAPPTKCWNPECLNAFVLKGLPSMQGDQLRIPMAMIRLSAPIQP